ncbi:hypothetical protein RUND412_003209 [Rhizina undulata]
MEDVGSSVDGGSDMIVDASRGSSLSGNGIEGELETSGIGKGNYKGKERKRRETIRVEIKGDNNTMRDGQRERLGPVTRSQSRARKYGSDISIISDSARARSRSPSRHTKLPAERQRYTCHKHNRQSSEPPRHTRSPMPKFTTPARSKSSVRPPKTILRPHRPESSTSSRLRTSVSYADQRSLLEEMYRLCLDSSFAFCKHQLKLDLTRNVTDPSRSGMRLETLIDGIIGSWNFGDIDHGIIDEDVGFGSGNAFARAACVVDAVIYRMEVSDRRLLSILQAGEEFLGALRDKEAGEKADAVYKRAEALISEGRREMLEME